MSNNLGIDPSEPCAECGVPLGSHKNGMAVASRADRADHAWSMFSAPPTPYVPGGEFATPKSSANTAFSPSPTEGGSK
jgi:hypothetical protein